jgi:hypothetical protein
MMVGAGISAEYGFGELCQAAQRADWRAVRIAYQRLPIELEQSAEALLLHACAIAAESGVDAAQPLINQAVATLFVGGDFLTNCFWGAFELISMLDQPRAIIICVFAKGLVERLGAGAFPLIEPMIGSVAEEVLALRVSPEPLIAALDAFIQRRDLFNARQTQFIAERMAEIAELTFDKDKAAEALGLAAQAAFACGRTDQALVNQMRAADHLGLHGGQRRIWSARPISFNAPASPVWGQVEWIAATAWVAALDQAHVVSGRVSYGSFYCLFAPGGGILLEEFQAVGSLHIGVIGSPLRAVSPSGDVLVDLSDRPEPWAVLEPVVLLGGSCNDDDWLLQHCPKLGLWRRSNMARDVEVLYLIDHQPSRRQSEVLCSLGLEASSIIQSDPYYDRLFDLLYVTSVPDINYATEFLRASFPSSEQTGPNLIYIMPSPSQRETVDAELVQAVINLGGEILVPDVQGMTEIAGSLAAAKVVIRWAGPGDAYLAFCSSQARVIEIIDSARPMESRSSAILGGVGAKLQQAAVTEHDINGVPILNIQALLSIIAEECG